MTPDLDPEVAADLEALFDDAAERRAVIEEMLARCAELIDAIEQASDAQTQAELAHKLKGLAASHAGAALAAEAARRPPDPAALRNRLASFAAAWTQRLGACG